jgi:hypothetical protein
VEPTTNSSTCSSQHFPSTHWSLIGRAQDGLEHLRRDALNALLARYWSPLKTRLVVWKRIAPDEAEDLVQGFIQEKVLERNLLAAADGQRGRFRNLLAAALDNYVATQWERRSAHKRAADRAMVMDDQAWTNLAGDSDLPDEAFDAGWARAVLMQAIGAMQAECLTSRREDLWGLFEARVLDPILEDCQPPGYDELVRRFGFASPSQATNALVTAKRMFARNLRSIVAQYALDEADVDAELVELQTILSRHSSHG